ncbi:hypothetical protein BHYA_0174g00110 [Botrytis hyacinthi]|uniref:Uncharacterized protein n=1 Tax=Botrytis hyacinthi TaxID=278943 RepID=A0A4Z1GDG8_9HELO|nr:hypothetical protein BHYA_0174g00110 [Botrytis hyacinthi]
MRSKWIGNASTKGVKVIKAIPVGQGPFMRLAGGSLQAVIEKERSGTMTNIDVKATEFRENLAVLQEDSAQIAAEKLMRVVKGGNAPEIMDISTEVGNQIDLNSLDLAMNVFKQMVKQSKMNQERRHRQNEENQERRYQLLCAIFTKRRDADPEACRSHSSEMSISESSSGFIEKSEEVEYHDTGADVDYSVARAPNVLADIDVSSIRKTRINPNTTTQITHAGFDIAKTRPTTTLSHVSSYHCEKYPMPRERIAIDLDNRIACRQHVFHADKQLIAWHLYENASAGHQVNVKPPNTLPYREIKASVPRGALIVVNRKICKDCKDFIEKVKKHFGISDHIPVKSRTHLEDKFDTENPNKLVDSRDKWEAY